MINHSEALWGSESRFFHEEVGSTMKHRIAVSVSAALVLLAGSIVAGETLKSGPQKGDNLPGPFSPLNINGANAGQKVCQV